MRRALECAERKASKKYPQPRKGRAASNGGEGNFLENPGVRGEALQLPTAAVYRKGLRGA